MGIDDADLIGPLLTDFDSAEEFTNFDDVEYPDETEHDLKPEGDPVEHEPEPPEPDPEPDELEVLDEEDPEPLDNEESVDPEPEPAKAPGVDPYGPPVVAVCGTGGGAGTTTVTALMAFIASRQDRGPVLLTDLGGPSASLAALIGKKGNYSLGSAANAHRIGLFANNGTAPFAKVNENLRLMAKEPDALDLTPDSTDSALTDLLEHAQEDHYATFIDCGRLELPAEQQVAASATHVVWVVGGTKTEARKARAMIASLGFSGSRGSMLYVRSEVEAMPDLPVQEELGKVADENSLGIIVAGPVGDLVSQGLMPTAARARKPVGAMLERILR